MDIRYILLLLFLAPVNAAAVISFVSPDNSFSVLKNFLAGARNMSIASYTFTSNDIAELLHGNVTILVDSSPVGGLPAESKAIFCRLTARGMRVYLYSGQLRFMHAKYIVKDNAALITSENLGDDGFPASPHHGNRGWGVVVEDEGTAKQLEDIFLKDISNSEPFVCDGNYSLPPTGVSGSYNSIFKPERFENQSVRLVIAPNAVPILVDLINSARSHILVEQFYIHRYFDRKSKSDNPLLLALVNAARRSVNVSVLLDSFYYNVESDDPSSNLYTTEYLNNLSKAENLSIEVRLINLNSGILKLHNKALIADDAVLISSINWNQNSPTRNREVGIIVKGEVADYFANIFNYDFYPENRITGFAAARNYVGIGLFIAAIIFLMWLRKRQQMST